MAGRQNTDGATPGTHGADPWTGPLDGRVVVVTGAASGIGAALGRALAERGATVVLNDVARDALTALAEELGAHAVPGDASDPQDVERLVGTTWLRHGRLDLFCANAGVAPPGSLDAGPEVWEQAWQVNVMSHVHAARSLVPRWLEQGSGHLLTTVSAAGLLTLLGQAPYAVSKHAALAFSEWLRATYAHRGIVVQALCPQGVLTPMLAGSDERTASMLAPNALTAGEVARVAVEALAGGRFLVLPHQEVAGYYSARADDTDRWLAGLNRMQQELEATSTSQPVAVVPVLQGT